MAGRPPLRIGQHGKISRKYIGNGVCGSAVPLPGHRRRYSKSAPCQAFR
jgi:hypothetical protein